MLLHTWTQSSFTPTIHWLVSVPVWTRVFFFGQSVYGWKEAGKVYCNKSITMLQSMIIDWDVRWPHAGKVTADTAANHSVSRQRSREWRSEGGRVKSSIFCFHKKIYIYSIHIYISKLFSLHHRPSLNIHVPRLVGPLEELPDKPCRPFRAAWVELIGKVLQERCGVMKGRW